MRTSWGEVQAVTKYNGIGKGSNVYFFEKSFRSHEMLYLSMGHEYLHAGFFSNNLLNSNSQHAEIYRWQYQQAKLWNYNVKAFQTGYLNFNRFLNSDYNYENLGFFLINTRPNW